MNEPYIIKASEFDPEKHEIQRSIGGTVRWVNDGIVPGVPNDLLIIVRDKPEPRFVAKGGGVIDRNVSSDPEYYVAYFYLDGRGASDKVAAQEYADWKNSQEDA